MTRFRCDCTECEYIGIGNIAGNDRDLVDRNSQSFRSVAQLEGLVAEHLGLVL